jgi:predicted amidohydrolase
MLLDYNYFLNPMKCYDLRFPELSLSLAQKGADILTYPSAFTFITGAAHWEVRNEY